jgi:hypothetical protein
MGESVRLKSKLCHNECISEMSMAVKACFLTEIQCSQVQNYETRRILSISNNRSSPKQSLWSNSQHFSNNHRSSGAVAVSFQPRWTSKMNIRIRDEVIILYRITICLM